MRGAKERDIDYRALYDRYLAGESGVAIATSVGIGYDGLYKAWRRHGWPLRSVRSAARLLAKQRPERSALIEYATRVRRGGHDTDATKHQRARTRQERGLGISDQERILAERLRAEGHVVTQQRAVGPYNVDITLDDLRIAIEVDGGGHSKRSREGAAERRRFIAQQGWRVIHIWAKSRSVGWEQRAMDAIHAAIHLPV